MGMQHPGLEHFAEHASEHLRKHPGDLFALESQLEALLSTETVADLVNGELQRIGRDRDYASADWDSPGLLLGGSDTWELRLGVYDRTPENIYSLPFDLVIAVIGPGHLDFERFDFPIDVEQDQLHLVERQQLPPGSTAHFAAMRDAVAIRVTTPVAVLKLSSNIRTGLQWAFCRATHRSLQALSADARHSDLVSMARALGAMRRTMSAATLSRLAEHDAHFVRWAALQALAQVHPEQALHKLREAAIHDVHPQVRNSAARALALQAQVQTAITAKS